MRATARIQCRFRLAKQQVFKCISLFHCHHCMTTMWNYFMFYEWHKASIFFFYCLNLVTVLKISTREKLTNIWPIAQGEIIATMFEAARIYFLIHAFAAVAVVDALKATVPNNILWRLLRTWMDWLDVLWKKRSREGKWEERMLIRVDQRGLVWPAFCMHAPVHVQIRACTEYGNVGHQSSLI